MPGSRKLWGTLHATTAAVVSSIIGKLTTVGKFVEVKRKYKSQPNGSPILEILNGGSCSGEVKMF